MNQSLSRHYEASVSIAAAPAVVFATLDDHRRLASHMEKPSLMMAGATMHIDTDAQRGQAIGSVIQMHGRVLGLSLHVAERVTRYEPPLAKAWHTFGEPRLLIVGHYAMGFDLTPREAACSLRVWIDYSVPNGIGQRMLAWVFGDIYARWCVHRMLNDAAKLSYSPV